MSICFHIHQKRVRKTIDSGAVDSIFNNKCTFHIKKQTFIHGISFENWSYIAHSNRIFCDDGNFLYLHSPI